MESSSSSRNELASLSVFGLIGRSVEVYVEGWTAFLAYGAPIFAIQLLFGTDPTPFTNTLGVLTLLVFANSFALHQAWIVDQAASIFLGIKDRKSANAIAVKTSKGQSFAIMKGTAFFSGMTGSSFLSTILGLLAPFLQFQCSVIAMEDTNILQAAKRSASITWRVFSKLIWLGLVSTALFFCVCGATGMIIGSIAKDMGVMPEDPSTFLLEPGQQFREWLGPFADLLIVSLDSFVFLPMGEILYVGLYLQYRCQKEGMTPEKLVQELLMGDMQNVEGNQDCPQHVNAAAMSPEEWMPLYKGNETTTAEADLSGDPLGEGFSIKSHYE